MVRPPLPSGAASWFSLNGLVEHEFAADFAGTPRAPIPFGRRLNGTILLPFPPESCLSGVGAFEDYPNSTPNMTFSWYRAVFDAPLPLSASILLHVEACDWNCTVWVNGKLVVSHTGGYDAFSADVTPALKAAANELLIFTHDPTEWGNQPQGKQLTLDVLRDHVDGNKYCPSSGVWGDVWLESVPAQRIDSLRLRANSSSLFLWVALAGVPAAPGCALNVSISLRGSPVASDAVGCAAAAPAGAGVEVPVPSPQAWAPGSPTLYDVSVALLPGGSAVADLVSGYFGLRAVALESYARPAVPPQEPLQWTGLARTGKAQKLKRGDAWGACSAACAAAGPTACQSWEFDEASSPPTCAFAADVGSPLVPGAPTKTAGRAGVPAGPAARPTLNGAPNFALAWLDQSWFPDGLYRAPTDAALAFDLEAALALGFNAVRVHTKVNPRRFYYHADRLGVLLLQDFPQKFENEKPVNTRASVPLFLQDAAAAVEGRGNSPAIVQWIVFNEGDCVGSFNASEVVAWLEGLDGQASPHGERGAGRLVDTNSGGPANALGVGEFNDVHTYPAPGGPHSSATQAAMVGEFSGLGWFPPPALQWVADACYTYLELATPQLFADLYCNYTRSLVIDSVWLSRAVATQATDLECECDVRLRAGPREPGATVYPLPLFPATRARRAF